MATGRRNLRSAGPGPGPTDRAGAVPGSGSRAGQLWPCARTLGPAQPWARHSPEQGTAPRRSGFRNVGSVLRPAAGAYAGRFCAARVIECTRLRSVCSIARAGEISGGRGLRRPATGPVARGVRPGSVGPLPMAGGVSADAARDLRARDCGVTCRTRPPCRRLVETSPLLSTAARSPGSMQQTGTLAKTQYRWQRRQQPRRCIGMVRLSQALRGRHRTGRRISPDPESPKPRCAGHGFGFHEPTVQWRGGVHQCY